MAGECVISVRSHLFEEREVQAIAEAVEQSVFDVVGRLTRLWGYAVEQSVGGFVADIGARTVDALVQLPGFAAAMQQVEWLQIDEDGVRFPRFEKYLSPTARKKALAAARKARSRAAAPPVVSGQDSEQGSGVSDQESEKREEQADRHKANTDRQPVSDKPPLPITDAESVNRKPLADTGGQAASGTRTTPNRPQQGESVFSRVTVETLRDCSQLREWFEWQARQPKPVLKDSEVDWLFCATAAVHALKKDGIRNRAAYFASIVGKDQRQLPTAEAEERARVWLMEERTARKGREQSRERASPQKIGDCRQTPEGGPQTLGKAEFLQAISGLQQQFRRA